MADAISTISPLYGLLNRLFYVKATHHVDGFDGRIGLVYQGVELRQVNFLPFPVAIGRNTDN